MSSEQQIREPNQIQLIVGALIQANQIAQQIKDENIKTVLLNTTHHTVSLINVLNKQFDICLKEFIHRSLIVEDPEEDSKLTLKLEKGKVNKLILDTICEKYQIRLLKFQWENQVEENLWEPKRQYFWNLSNQNQYSVLIKSEEMIKSKNKECNKRKIKYFPKTPFRIQKYVKQTFKN